MNDEQKTETEATAPELPPAAERPLTLLERTRSKQERKKLKALDERKEFLRQNGLDEEQISQVIAQEKYDALPIDQKLKRMEMALQATVRQIGHDIQNLRHNDGVLADAMDVNFRAVHRALKLAGVSEEQQKEIVEQITAEMAEAEKKKVEATQAQVAEEELKTAESGTSIPSEGAETPEGATTFE